MRRRSLAALAAAAALLLCVAAAGGRCALAQDEPPPEDVGCGLSGGALTLDSADNGDGDFAVFGLFDKDGNRIARQYVPTYNPDASGELMLTPIGSGETVASVKCLAETSLQRCGDADWVPEDDGVNVSLIGFLLGDDYAVVSVKARYHSHDNGMARSIDGTAVGFTLDKDPVQWSELFDSQDDASEAFFDMPHGAHEITIGWRDPDTLKLVPQDRICFKT
ncbi:MAG TPA: hypothetical protein VMH02_05540 [Verrucomicrobiae bacterium]|nr:hypothetical protein [Verrucomicrobiae bacterium]